jgi:hypothetical protein
MRRCRRACCKPRHRGRRAERSRAISWLPPQTSMHCIYWPSSPGIGNIVGGGENLSFEGDLPIDKKKRRRRNPLGVPPACLLAAGCKPNSVFVPKGARRRPFLWAGCCQPAQAAYPRMCRLSPAPLWPGLSAYLALLPVGFAMPPESPPARCALTAPFHPYPSKLLSGRFSFCWRAPFKPAASSSRISPASPRRRSGRHALGHETRRRRSAAHQSARARRSGHRSLRAGRRVRHRRCSRCSTTPKKNSNAIASATNS